MTTTYTQSGRGAESGHGMQVLAEPALDEPAEDHDPEEQDQVLGLQRAAQGDELSPALRRRRERLGIRRNPRLRG